MGVGNREVGKLVLLPRMTLPKTIDVSEKSQLLAIGTVILNKDGFLDAVQEIRKYQSGEVNHRLGARFLRSSPQA